jgi:hypothetical protein
MTAASDATQTTPFASNHTECEQIDDGMTPTDAGRHAEGTGAQNLEQVFAERTHDRLLLGAALG